MEYMNGFDHINTYTKLSKAASLSNSIAIISPCGKYLATAISSKLVVRNIRTLEGICTYKCIDKIDYVEYSPDSSYILCGIYSRCTVQAFGIQDSSWNCRINENIAGLSSAKWTPDSRHIITSSDFGIQMAIWCLVDSTVYLISSPKVGYNMSSFSDSNGYMAVALRLDCKDHIGIYSCGQVDDKGQSDWSEISKFRSRTNDLTSVRWSPSTSGGGLIVITDCALVYRVIVYTPAGEEVANIEAYADALGVRGIDFSPATGVSDYSFAPDNLVVRSGYNGGIFSPHARFLAVSSYDGVVRLITTVCWKVVFVLPMTHPKEMRVGFGGGAVPISSLGDQEEGSSDRAVTIVEMISEDSNADQTWHPSRHGGPRAFVRKNIKMLPRVSAGTLVTVQTLSGDKSPPVTGLAWSHCGRWLASTDPEGCPRCIWVWEAGQGRLVALLVLLEPVQCMAWRPSSESSSEASPIAPLLAFCTGTQLVYFWSPVVSERDGQGTGSLRGGLGGPEGLPTWRELPSQSADAHSVSVTNLKWSSDGTKIVILTKNADSSYCISLSQDGSDDLSPPVQTTEESDDLKINETSSLEVNSPMKDNSLTSAKESENIPPSPVRVKSSKNSVSPRVSTVTSSKPNTRAVSGTGKPVSTVLKKDTASASVPRKTSTETVPAKKSLIPFSSSRVTSTTKRG